MLSELTLGSYVPSTVTYGTWAKILAPLSCALTIGALWDTSKYKKVSCSEPLDVTILLPRYQTYVTRRCQQEGLSLKLERASASHGEPESVCNGNTRLVGSQGSTETYPSTTRTCITRLGYFPS